MKPQNFEKIEGMSFEIDTRNFHTEIDVKNSNNLWVFADDGNVMLGKYCIQFIINWSEFKINMRKCLLGKGDEGEDIFIGLPISISNFRTPIAFIDLVKLYIQRARSVGTFVN